jgi:hypothetical protein
LRRRLAAAFAALTALLTVLTVAGLATATQARADTASGPIVTFSTPIASAPAGIAAEEDMTLQSNPDGSCPWSSTNPVYLWGNTATGTFYLGATGSRFTACGQTIKYYEAAYAPGTYVEDPGWVSPTGYASFGTFNLQATGPLKINLSGDLTLPVGGGTTTVTATIPSNPDGSCFLGSNTYADAYVALTDLAGGTQTDSTVSWSPYEALVNACDTPVSFQVTDTTPGNHTIKATYTNYDQAVTSATLTVGTPPPPADTTPPVITVPSNKVVEATGPNGAVVTFDAPTATDDTDTHVTVTCDHQSGDTFSIGTTTVTCTATDSSGNTATKKYSITVKVTPNLTVPPGVTAEATGANGAVVNFSATATVVTGQVTVSCTPSSGSQFALGDTQVTCIATSSSGDTAQSTFVVTVKDKTGPKLPNLPDVPVAATSSNGAVANYGPATANDAVDGPVAVTFSPQSGSMFGLGSHPVTYSATDAAGNTSSATFNVVVKVPWNNVQQPVNADGTSSFKFGSTVPWKVQALPGLHVTITFTKSDSSPDGTDMEAVNSNPADSGNTMRCDSTGFCQFNLGTKNMSVGDWFAHIDFGDGVDHSVKFSLRK